MLSSSGTWSLLGLELPGPVFSDEALTNERGVDGTIRLLEERHGPVARAGVRARVWESDFPTLQRAAREATEESPSSIPTTSASCAAATCPR